MRGGLGGMAFRGGSSRGGGTAWAYARMGSWATRVGETLCEYRRCGGKGRREVANLRRARVHVQVGGKRLFVCESCADLIGRDLMTHRVAPTESPPGPERVSEILGRMSPADTAPIAPRAPVQ